MKVRVNGPAPTSRPDVTPAAPAHQGPARPRPLEPDLPRAWVDGKPAGRDPTSHASLSAFVGTVAPAVAAVVAGLVSFAAPTPAMAAPNVGVAPTPPQDLGEATARAPGAAPAGPAAPAAPAPQQSAEERELVEKIGRLATARFGGNYQQLFDHYAGSDHRLVPDELSRLLSDAGVGNVFTRSAWVSGIMQKLDKNADGSLAWSELRSLASD